MKSQLQQLVQQILQDMGVTHVLPDVSNSEDPAHGEYTTNVAMRLASAKGGSAFGGKQSPMDIALQVKKQIEVHSSQFTDKGQDQKIGKQDHPISPKTPLSPLLQAIDHIEVAPPGFINVFLSEGALSTKLAEVLKTGESYGVSHTQVPLDLKGEADSSARRIMVEFAHPNTHKAFHIGHLRNITTSESLARLTEFTGAEVIRVNYQGDVGLHIA